MKRFFQLTLAITFLNTVIFAQTVKFEREKQELIRLENATVTATDKRDLAMLDRLIADDFVGTTSRGGLKNKKETIASWTGNAPKSAQGAQTTTGVVTTLNDFNVRINGKTAIVTGVDRAVYQKKEGGEIISEARFTDIWEKRKIGWQLVAGHVSRVVKMPDAALLENDLKNLRKDLDSAFAVRDADKQANAFAAAGIFIAGGAKPFEGRAAYRESLLRVMQRPNIVLTHAPSKFEISASVDLAYELGEWTESWNEPDGLTTLTGKYFTVWKKADGGWQIAAETLKPYKCIGGNYCKQ